MYVVSAVNVTRHTLCGGYHGLYLTHHGQESFTSVHPMYLKGALQKLLVASGPP